MKTITVGKVEMPLSDLVVSRNAILGITKSGKTYTAKGIAEQLLDAGVPVETTGGPSWRLARTVSPVEDDGNHKTARADWATMKIQTTINIWFWASAVAFGFILGLLLFAPI